MFDEVIVRKVIGQIVENDQGNKKGDSRDQCGFADSKDHFGVPDISTTRTGEEEFRSSGVQEFRSSGVQEFRSSGVQGGADRKITSSKTAVVENLRSTQSRPMQAPELLNFCNS
jgi:hypothetical protein